LALLFNLSWDWSLLDKIHPLLSFDLNKNIPKKLPTRTRIFKFQINISALALRLGRRLSIKFQEKGIKTRITTQTF
jgi:hypothetical protein